MFIWSRKASRGIFDLLKRSSGISLIAVTIVMLVVSTLALIIASTMSTGSISSVTDIQAQQAFYLAQAGLEWYMEELGNDSDWSTPPTVKTDQSFGAGTFSVSYANQAEDSIDVTATGKVAGWDGNDVQRVITQHIEKTTGGDTFADFAIFFGGGDGTGTTTINKNQTITGDTFVYDDLVIGKNCTINGDVLATGTISVGSGTEISGDTLDHSSAPANQPTLDTTYYDNLITTASEESHSNRTFNGETLSGTEYVNGNVTIKDYVDGSGTIVATGRITINRNTDIGDNIALISSSTLKMKKNGNVGKDVTFYSSSRVQVDNGVVLGSGADTGEGVVLLSPQKVILKKNITITGLIFGADEVDIDKQNLTLTGNLCGGTLTELDKGAVITKDSAKVDVGSIQGFDSGAETTMTISSWHEPL